LPRRTLQSASELDYPPFALVRDGGTADGFSVELLKAVVEAVGYEVNFKVGPWNEIKEELIKGELDVLPLVSYSQERDKVFDFTAPYLRMHGAIFVRKSDKSIQSEADLKNKEVLVMRGDTAHEYAVRRKLTDTLILTDSFEDAMKQLSAGKHDAVVVQHLVGLQLIKKLGITNVVSVRSFEEQSLKPDAEPLSGFEQKFCIAVREGDKELLARLNEGLSLVITRGVYNELYEEWFGPILPKPSVSLATIFKYLLFILLPVLVLIGITGIWYLRREVARKTDTIKENEEKFSIVFNKAPLPVSLGRLRDGLLVDVNEAWTETFGFDRSQAIGRTPEELGISTNREERARVYADLQEKGSISNLELTGYRTHANPSAVILANLEVLEFGRENYVFASAQDITDRKRAEEALAASERKYRELVETANSIIIRWDNQGIIRFINDFGLRFFGYSAGELVNRHVMTLMPKVETSSGRDLDVLVKDILNHPEKHTYVPNENITRDGRIVWVAWTNKAILDEQGNVLEILAIGNDITTLKETEKALQNSNTRLELLTTIGQRLLRAEDPQLIVEDLCRLVMAHIDCQFFFNYLVDIPGRRMQLNACAGISAEEADSIRQLDFGVAVCGCVARDGERMIAENIRSSHDPRTELARSFGAQAYCCHPMKVQDELIGTLSFGTRTRKRFSSDEVELMKTVTDQVAVAMQRLLANRALLESEDRIRASLAEKEVLLKEIHHRVKNNMQIISSLVDLQADEVRDAAMRTVFQDVVFRVRSMAMVHEKLYQSSDLARVEFADYTQTLLGYLWRAQGATVSGLRLVLDLEPVLLPVNAAVPCGLILNELFCNALKHAFNGREKGKVTVSLREDVEGPVRLCVRDNGIGMPPELDLEKARTLGLRLVYMLARQLHAAVEVTGDEGTQFTITFERLES
jgi:PAS domain S-box-containing protein